MVPNDPLPADDASGATPATPADCPEASLVAHDLRNLLAVVMGHAGIQRQKIHDRSPAHQLDLIELEHSLESILQAAAHAEVLCKEMMSLADGRPPVKVPIQVAALATEVVELFTAFTDRFELVLEGPEELTIHGQRLEIERALLNLLWNAREAMSDHPEARRLFLRWGEAEHGVWLAVADEGPGLAPGQAGELSKAFHSHKEGDDRLRGLGLHMVARAMRRHGGRLHARNRDQVGPGPAPEEARGAVFTLEFGFAPELDFDLTPPPRTGDRPAIPAPRRR